MQIAQDGKTQIAPRVSSAQLLAMPGDKDLFRFEDMSAEAVGYRLSLIRKAYGFEKAEIADMLGIDRPSWSIFENGQRVITYERARRIYNKFGIGLDFIILGRVQGLDYSTVEKLRAVAGSLPSSDS